MMRVKSTASAVLILLATGLPATAGAQQTREKEAPPAPLPMRPVSFPEFQERTLRNGTKVIIVEDHEQPIVSLNLRLSSGAKDDPAGKAGLAALTASLLNKGTTSRTADEIAEAIDFVGGDLGAGAGDDWISVSATTLTEYVDTALVLMSDVVLHPTFPQDELETERRRSLSALQASLGQPAVLAQRRFMREVYGDHPYGAAETEASISAITRDDLAAFHAAHFRPDNAFFVVAGDVRPDDIVDRLDRHFGDWAGTTAAKAALPAPPERTQREIVFVHKPGTVQAVIRIGHLLPRATNEDWVTLDVLRQVLGGGSSGWFFQVLRQEKGYTYGAYAQTAKRVEPGYFVASAEVRNEVADSALDEFFRLLDRIRAEPVPTEDLRTAKDFMTGSFPLTIETPQQVARQIANVRLLGIGTDYLTAYRDRVSAVTAAELQRVAERRIRPDHAVVVVVGDATQILDKVSKFGSVRLVDADGAAIDPADLAVRSADVRFDGSSIEPGTRVYDIMVQGNAVAQYVASTTREDIDGVAAVRATGEMTGMGGGTKQEVAFEAATLRPLFATVEQNMGPNTLRIDMRVQDGSVVGTVDSPDGQTRDVSIDAVDGLLLPGMDTYAVMVADLDASTSFRAPVVNAQAGTLTTVEFRVVGESKVTVPAGEFDAYEIRISGGPVEQHIFVRKAAPHILLRQVITGQPVTIELKESK